MNPFREKPKPINDLWMEWRDIYPKPYDKRTVNPYTRTRVILMNGTEFEQVWFSHQFSRHTHNNDLRRELSQLRRSEQQQQKLVSCLKPPDETVLEHTIGYEQLAVDLTATLAKREPNREVKRALDFALLEDFDHLYRYANLLDMEQGMPAENLVGRYTEITPGRPTISEHRHPMDSIRNHIQHQDELLTKLQTGIITAAEQQTMNFYMNNACMYQSELGRKLYQEIGMIEEQHVTHYGSLLDPGATWLECLLMHQYTECYLYYSCHEYETDAYIKKVWAQLYEQEVTHLHKAAQLLKEHEGVEWEQIIPGGEFPALLDITSGIGYVRDVLSNQVELTAMREVYVPVDQLPADFDFFTYQHKVNRDIPTVPSHLVIRQYIEQNGADYRFEQQPSPIEALQNRKRDNTSVGREPAKVYAGVDA